MKNVGVIGIGNMGSHMASNLLNQGYPVVVYDVNTEAMEQLNIQGAVCGSSPKDVAEQADVLVLSLPNIEVLTNVFVGEDGILEATITGKTIIDTTTSTVKASVELAEKVAKKGGWMLDSPVTGGTIGAEKGSLSIMIGGDNNAFAAQMDIFETLGENIVYIGESGHGQVSKMINQMLMGAIYVSVAEGFGFAAQLGVDVEKVYQAIENGGAKSGILSGSKKHILSGKYEKGNLAQHGKDIDYIIEEANRNHSFVPVTAALHEVWNLARLKGYSEYGANTMFAVWEDILGYKLNETVKRADNEWLSKNS